MKKQGNDIRIPLAGIVRNTAPSVCQDGVMDEVINLRWKDGSYRPVGVPETIMGGESIEYTQIVIHTAMGYRHVLGVKDSRLYWFADLAREENEPDVLTPRPSPFDLGEVKGEIGLTQMGNLAVITDGNGVRYALYDAEKDGYSTPGHNYNGETTDVSLVPEGKVDIRVTAVTNDGGVPLVIAAKEGNLIADTGAKEGVRKTAFVNASNIVANKTIAAAYDKGFFCKGYFLACTAIELYDGSFVLQSRPVLLAPPYVTYDIDNEVEFADDDNGGWSVIKGVCSSATRFKRKDWEGMAGASKINFKKNTRNFVDFCDYGNVAYNTDGVAEIDYLPTAYKINQNIEHLIKGYYKYANIEVTDFNGGVPPLFTSIHYNKQSGASGTECFAQANKLQIKFNTDISPEMASIVKGVSVFVTREVPAYDFADDSLWSMRIGGTGKVEYEPLMDMILDGTFMFIPSYRNKDKIVKELNGLSSFYKVADVPFASIKKGDWIDLDLATDHVLQNLTEQERLTVDTFSRSTFRPNISYSYNGRLHIADYRSSLFHGFPVPYFYANKAVGQYDPKGGTLTSGRVTIGGIVPGWGTGGTGGTGGIVPPPVELEKPPVYLIRAEVELKTEAGTANVIRAVPGDMVNFRMLNPIISYPDTRATRIRMTFQKHVSGEGYDGWNYAVLEFSLTPHNYLNFAYYISPDLEPIGIEHWSWSDTPLTGLPEESGTDEYVPNGLKVSAADNPLYFPPSQTYRIGNSRVLGLAANTVAVSTGQAGDAPLYVFSLDGIYALFVDTTGNVAYNFARPISREICNNARSITPIDDAVLFSSDRGIMALSGADIRDISDAVEGDPFRFTDKGDVSYINTAALSVDHPRLVTLSRSVSDEDFKEYIKHCTIGYNYHERELWVCRPDSDCSYVYRGGIWTKRTVVAEEFIADFPKLYIKTKELNIADLSRETYSGAVQTMMMSRPIKFDTSDFKQSYRAVLRSLLLLPESAVTDVRHLNLDTLDTTPPVRRVTIGNPAHKEIEVNVFAPDKERVDLEPVWPVPLRGVWDDVWDYLRLPSFELVWKVNRTGDEVIFPNSGCASPYKDDPEDEELTIYFRIRHKVHGSFRYGNRYQTEPNVPGIECRLKSEILVRYDGVPLYPDGHTEGSPASFAKTNGGKVTDGSAFDTKFGDTYMIWETFSDYTELTELRIPYSNISSDTRERIMADLDAGDVSGFELTDGVAESGVAVSDMKVYCGVREGNDAHNRALTVIENGFVREKYPDHVIAELSADRMRSNPQAVMLPGEVRSNGGYTAMYLKPLTDLYFLDKTDRDYVHNFFEPFALTTGWYYESFLYDYGSDVPRFEPKMFRYTGESTETVPADLQQTMEEYPDLFAEVDEVPDEYHTVTVTGRYATLSLPQHADRDFMIPDSETLPVTMAGEELVERVDNGTYPPIPEYDRELLDIANGEHVRLKDHTGEYHNIVYKGRTPIHYAGLLSNIRNDVYETWDYIDISANEYTLYIGAEECIEMRIYNDPTESYNRTYRFKSTLESGEYDVKDIILRYDNGMLAKIPAHNDAYPLHISKGSCLSVILDGRKYLIIYDGEEDTTLKALVEYIHNGGYRTFGYTEDAPLSGLYVFGSYDCRRWALLGAREKGGAVRDLGCLTARVDCKYFRFMFVGKLLHGSTIERLEIAAAQTLYGKKTR